MQEDNLHEKSKPIFWKNNNITISFSSAESAQRMIRLKCQSEQ